MKTIIKIKFGSHLYGTNTPSSDEDFKSIFLPDARDILLQRVKGSISTQRPKALGEKNFAGELDFESYSLQRFLGLLSEGQTVALDMLFAPEWAFIGEVGPEWKIIQENSSRLVTKKSASFIGYCRQQANKYGIRGSRVAASRAALELLTASVEKYGTTAKLAAIADEIQAIASQNEHMALLEIEQGTGQSITHWSVCEKKMSFTASIKNAQYVMQNLFNEYGHRALQAEKNEGVDFKALSHAVRIGHEAIELLQTGFITFPRPDAAHLLKIKKGELPYKEIGEEIDQLLPRVEEEAEKSKLRDRPDLEWIDDFIVSNYGKVVKDEIH